MITIDIELKDRNRIKEFFHKIHSKLEDMLFSIVQQIPEKFLPHWLINQLEKYLDKRINELKQESIRMSWRNMHLQNAVDNIRKSK